MRRQAEIESGADAAARRAEPGKILGADEVSDEEAKRLCREVVGVLKRLKENRDMSLNEVGAGECWVQAGAAWAAAGGCLGACLGAACGSRARSCVSGRARACRCVSGGPARSACPAALACERSPARLPSLRPRPRAAGAADGGD